MTPRRELTSAVVLCLVGAALVLLAVGRVWARVVLPAPPPLPDVRLALTGADLAPGLRALGLLALASVAALPAARGRLRVLLGVLVALAGAGALALSLRFLAGPTAAVRGADRLRDASAAGVAAPAVDPSAAAVLAVLGGVLVLLAGLLVAVRGPRWAALGRRYDAPSAATPRGAAVEQGVQHPAGGAAGPAARRAAGPSAGPAAGPAAPPAGAAPGGSAGASGGGSVTVSPAGEREVWEALDRGEDPTAEPDAPTAGPGRGTGTSPGGSPPYPGRARSSPARSRADTGGPSG